MKSQSELNNLNYKIQLTYTPNKHAVYKGKVKLILKKYLYMNVETKDLYVLSEIIYHRHVLYAASEGC